MPVIYVAATTARGEKVKLNPREGSRTGSRQRVISVNSRFYHGGTKGTEKSGVRAETSVTMQL
jgi:hypothetical protein